ncbi:hypothetical protein FQN50_000383 [Emmonsiellopsis sp. PD_5]|nr:hypothetical protein FQN50_000383 [Emmonsiellopsis sp. PD_5]
MASTHSMEESGESQEHAPPPPSKKRKASTVQFPEAETHTGKSSTSYFHLAHLSTRAQRQKLHLAQPSVQLLPWETKEAMPEGVSRFFSEVLDKLDSPLSSSLLRLLQAKELRSPDIPALLEDLTQQDHELWRNIRYIVDASNRSFEVAGDETRWTEVVRPLIVHGMGGEKNDLFEVIPIQTTPIGPRSLIPTLADKPIAFKEIDLAVVFSEANTDLNNLYKRIGIRHPGLTLCQSEDLLLSQCSQFTAIEIKSPDGSYYAASIQLAVWLSAGLEKMRQLREQAAGIDNKTGASYEPLMPFVGIIVTGCVWNLHLADKAEDGTVRIYGPLIIGDTATSRGVLRINAALDYVRTWGEEVYYPWLKAKILEPLASDETAGSAQGEDPGEGHGRGSRGGRGGRGGQGGKDGRGGRGGQSGKDGRGARGDKKGKGKQPT